MWNCYCLLGFFIGLAFNGNMVYSYECEMGWTLFDESCYKAYTPEDVCDDYGAYIVSISSPNENEFVRNTPTYYNETTGMDSRRIGLTIDVKNELRYSWKNGETDQFTNWATDQPDHDEYVHMNIQTGLWQTNFYNGRLPICEKPRGRRSECPIGWEKLDDSCYKAPNSAEICSSVGSHLITIHSQRENNFANILGDTSNRGASYRIGLTVEKNNSEPFSWQDGFKVTYTNWETDKLRKQKMTKVVYMTTGSGQGKWNIKRDYFNPICEKKALADKPPVLRCPTTVMTYETETADGLTAMVNYDLPEVKDNSHKNLVAECSPAPGSHFRLGETTVHCSATDAYGHRGDCTFMANVVAAMGEFENITTDPPKISCPTDRMRILTNSAEGAQVFYYPATYVYAEREQLAPCSPASGSHFEVGITTVSCQAMDLLGRSDKCSFEISVEEEEEVVECDPDSINAQASSNTAESSGAYIIPVVVVAICVLVIIVVIIVAVKVVKRKLSSYNPSNVTMATGNLYNDTSIDPVGPVTAFDDVKADQHMNQDIEATPPENPTSSFSA
ncbi:uncharacterized protein [Antedon mediterranea]|uniref:uncharacterized protein isoform X2 n=1 Tax=Antedon mediterranea TaxID=105859 RepID=UPI003AF7BBBD